MGRAIRYSLLAYLGSMYSKQIFDFFHAYYQRTLWTAVALAVIGGLAAFIWSWRRKRRGKPVTPDANNPQPGRRSNTSVNIMAYAVARPDARQIEPRHWRGPI